MLNIPDAHRLIADYTVIVSEEQDNKVLMVLHPYQIHAIEALYVAASKHTLRLYLACYEVLENINQFRFY